MGLGGYIFLFERDNPADKAVDTLALVLPALKASQVTSVEYHATNLTVRVEQTNESWRMTAPLNYPGRKANIEALIEECRKLNHKLTIPARDVKNQPRGLADYGLEPPAATLKMRQGGTDIELRIGMKTPVGNLLYLQLAGSQDVLVTDAAFLNYLPRTASDWRDVALLNLAGLNFNRLEMRPRPPGFEVVKTNGLWRMSWPIDARADNPRLNLLIDQLQRWPVAQFLIDDPRVDLEPLGLSPPQAELVIGNGTNDLVVVQFGHSPTNVPGYVLARRPDHTNIVLVSRMMLDQLRAPHTQFRDRRLLSFDPAQVDTIEIQSDEAFTLQRTGTNGWRIGAPFNYAADAELVTNLVAALGQIDVVDFVKDVNSADDYASFGLAAPAKPRQYALKMAVTNNTGGLTNQLLAQMDIGRAIPPQNLTAYVRRPDDGTVYALSMGDYQQLPREAWTLRDRQLPRFTTNQVVSITSVLRGKLTKMTRNAAGDWSLATPGIVETFAVDDALELLGQLRAVAWTARGENRQAQYEISDTFHAITIELLQDGKPQTVTYKFGNKRAPGFNPYTSTVIDGETIIFQFPQKAYDDRVVKYLTFP